jgi:hypothetical protein
MPSKIDLGRSVLNVADHARNRHRFCPEWDSRIDLARRTMECEKNEDQRNDQAQPRQLV